jgi:hypothetical protein
MSLNLLLLPGNMVYRGDGVGQAIAPSDDSGRRTGRKVRAPAAGCQVTPGGRESTESATENIPPRIGDGSG